MMISDSMLGFTLLLPAKTNLCGSMFAQILYVISFIIKYAKNNIDSYQYVLLDQG